MIAREPIKRIVMQPTSLCNLNCKYCYLAHRNKNQIMNLSISEAVAKSIEDQKDNVCITWHGGEPLSCGIDHFKSLLLPFESLRTSGYLTHSIQTNATLINDDWCSLFKEYSINVGVSIDGPEWANYKRVNWSSKESYLQIMRGIDFLKNHQIPFTTICVVGEVGLERAPDLYEFFCKLGCFEVGFNLEEKVGIYTFSVSDNYKLVKKFWSRLFLEWRKNPIILVREFSRALTWMETVSENFRPAIVHEQDLFPSISYDGNVVLLSPEFLDAKSEHYGDFIAGNVLQQSLVSILDSGEELEYVRDFRKGVEKCAQVCEYSEYCMGGQASNKFFELGSTNGTETTHCRNVEQRLVDAVLSAV